MNQTCVGGTGTGQSVLHTSVYIQRVGCLGVLHRPYRIQMGLEGDLGGGGKDWVRKVYVPFIGGLIHMFGDWGQGWG